jgi:lysine 2,3-aminomutase
MRSQNDSARSTCERSTIEEGLAIIRALRDWTSGLGVSHYVIDAPGGSGNIPLFPESVEPVDGGEVMQLKHEGRRYVCERPSQGHPLE